MGSLDKKLCRRCITDYGCVWDGGDEDDWGQHLVWCPYVRVQTTKRTLTMKKDDFRGELPKKAWAGHGWSKVNDDGWYKPPPDFCPFVLEQLLLLESEQ